ncbi:transcription termination/antitermination protein NusG [Enterovirga sp. CN4-39]|uniref:transcription termination/antitermination protein NusG n=1 Tax=Enterovirga sp. CN4-39 TaxID=3400910 RepID=UPI003C0A87AE
MVAVAVKAQSVQKARDRLAAKRVILLDQPTLPPAVEAIWSRSWFALFVYPGQEWEIRRELQKLGFDVFLPVQTYWNSSRFRVKRQLERPLLLRYVLVGIGSGPRGYISDDDWARLKSVESVHAILGDRGGRPVRMPIENLVQLAGEVASGQYDETKNTYEAGQALVITKGMFSGCNARTKDAVPREAAPDDPIRVIVRMFGRDTITKIPLADLRCQ